MQFGLSDPVIEKIKDVFIKYPQIEKAILYGSRAKGNFKNGSDIDLTLSGAGLNLNLLYKIETEIDDLLLPYSFDLSILEQISNPGLVEHIARVGIVFYEKNAGMNSMAYADDADLTNMHG
jgi:predicted nucleotidyltransferase